MTLSIAKFDSLLGYTHAVAVAEKTELTMVADVAGSLNNKYFRLSDSGALSHHVWFNVNGAGIDPAPVGSTGIPVAIATNATATAVATAVAAAVDANAAFIATASSTKVTVTNAVAAEAADAIDFNSGVTVSVVTQGRDNDQRYVVPVSDFQAYPNPDLTGESDHFGYIWKTLATGVRMTGMTFAYDGATRVVLVLGNPANYNSLNSIPNAYNPV